MLSNKKLQRGDTIVEVLFAVVMIGITLAVSFAIANRNLQITRASQEQAEALKIAESKIELIKIEHKDTSSSIRTRKDDFCVILKKTGGIQVVDVNPSNCTNETVSGGTSGLFTITTHGPQSKEFDLDVPPTYRVEVTWDRVGTDSSEKGSVVLYYRPGGL